jgi:hypothetical protein
MAKFDFDENQENYYQPNKKTGKQDLWAQGSRKKTKVKKFKYKNL